MSIIEYDRDKLIVGAQEDHNIYLIDRKKGSVSTLPNENY